MLKVVNGMIYNRIKSILYPLLRTKKNRFRPGRSTTAQILTLRGIIEAIRPKICQKKLHSWTSEKPLILSTGERFFRFSRPMASPHGWRTPLVKPTRKHRLMSPPLTVKPNSSKSPQTCYKETHSPLVHNSSGLCTSRGYRGSRGESWANNQV